MGRRAAEALGWRVALCVPVRAGNTLTRGAARLSPLRLGTRGPQADSCVYCSEPSPVNIPPHTHSPS